MVPSAHYHFFIFVWIRAHDAEQQNQAIAASLCDVEEQTDEGPKQTVPRDEEIKSLRHELSDCQYQYRAREPSILSAYSKMPPLRLYKLVNPRLFSRISMA